MNLRLNSDEGASLINDSNLNLKSLVFLDKNQRKPIKVSSVFIYSRSTDFSYFFTNTKFQALTLVYSLLVSPC